MTVQSGERLLRQSLVGCRKSVVIILLVSCLVLYQLINPYDDFMTTTNFSFELGDYLIGKVVYSLHWNPFFFFFFLLEDEFIKKNDYNHLE